MLWLIKDKSNRTPLLYAAETKYEAVIKLLLERDDIVVDSKDDNGRTPLSWAAEEGRYSIVKLLINRDDVDVDSEDNEGHTPLWWASVNENAPWAEVSKRRHGAVIKLLVEHKAKGGKAETGGIISRTHQGTHSQLPSQPPRDKTDESKISIKNSY